MDFVSGQITTLRKLSRQVHNGKTTFINDVGHVNLNGMLREEDAKKAEVILLNLGSEDCSELKEIYMNTTERSFRDFLYVVLKEKELLTERDFEDYLYVMKVEELYAEDNFHVALRDHKFTWSTNITYSLPVSLSYQRMPELSLNAYKADIKGGSPVEHSSCYSLFSMKQVRLWTAKRRKLIMLDGVFIADAEFTISNEYSSDLWDYLIYHNQLRLLERWIENIACSEQLFGKQVFPDLPEKMPMEFITAEMKERLLHLLVKNGYYPECILHKFHVLLHYLGATNVLFNKEHPMVHYKKSISFKDRSELVDNFDNNFLCFCQENNLVMLTWHYVSHYGISLSRIKVKDKIKSWLFMLLSFHDVATKWNECNETRESLLFTVFSENTRFLYDNKTADCTRSYSLSDMLRNNQLIIALASALICQNMFAYKFAEIGDRKIDRSLVTKSDYLYPQLFQAIYNEDLKTGEGIVNIYKLLHNNTELNVYRWFGWQPDNCAVKGDNILFDLPYFSNTALVEKYGHKIKLDYRFYLEQFRPMFAYLIYTRDLEGCSNKLSPVSNILMLETYSLAIRNFNNLPLISSCMFFLDLLEIDNTILKIDTQVARNICTYWDRCHSIENKYSSDESKQYLIDRFLVQNNTNFLMDILKLLEDTTEIIVQENNIDKISYDAIWYWELVMIFCHVHSLPLSTRYIEACCGVDDWLKIFLFIHFYQLPSLQVISVIQSHMKNNVLRDHIIAIVHGAKKLRVIKPEERRKKIKNSNASLSPIAIPVEERETKVDSISSMEEQKRKNISIFSLSTSTQKESCSTKTPSLEDPLDLEVKNDCKSFATCVTDDVIDIILACEKHESPWESLLSNGIVLFNEIFAVLASCYARANITACHCVWYICSINNESHGVMLQLCKDLLGIEIDKEDIPLALQSHHWSENDLLVLTKGLLMNGIKYTKLIIQGFKIFRSDDILVYILEFSQLFLFEENPVNSLERVKMFQSEFERRQNEISADDIKFCEVFSYQVTEVLLSLSKDTYHVRNLVGLLADANFGSQFSITVPNYASIRNTIDVIYKAGVIYPVKRLCSVNKSHYMQCINEIIDELLKGSRFDEASEVASFHNLPKSKITLNKVMLEFEELSKTEAWNNTSIRHSFLSKADELFSEQRCSCELAAAFFEDQVTRNVSYTNSEKSCLLLLAMQWHQASIHRDIFKISKLEEEVWMHQIKAEVESQTSDVAYINSSIFQLGICTETCNVPHSYFQRTCSDILMMQYDHRTELLQESNETKGGSLSPLLSTQEEYAFECFIGNLLDNICITEARRVASYFQRTTHDLEIVLSAIYLAQGTEAVDGLSDYIKSILAATTSHHIVISGLLESSGSSSRLDSLQTPVSPSAGCMEEFVFVEEVENALEKLALRVKCGKKCLQQVVVCFKIATMLSFSYVAIVTEDSYIVLGEVLDKDTDMQHQLSRQLINAFDLPVEEVTNLIAETMINWIKISSSHTFDQIVSLLKLTENKVQVGNIILEEVIDMCKSNVSHSRNEPDLICEVEMLIYAHHCFTMCCDMEGIARILHFAGLCTKSLVKLQMHSQMVRLLTGIGRFNEMVYVLEFFYNQQSFEILYNQGHIKDDKLKKALLDFLKKFHPKDLKNFQIVAQALGMYRELAIHYESIGYENINAIKVENLNLSKDLVSRLKVIKKSFSLASDYYLKEDCVSHAQKCVRMARLAELQVQLLPTGSCILYLTADSAKTFLREHKNFLESYMVADSYELDIPLCFADALFHNVVLNGSSSYLQQYMSYFRLTSSVVTQVASLFQNEGNAEVSGNMEFLLCHLRDWKTKLKIAKELELSGLEKELMDGGTYLHGLGF